LLNGASRWTGQSPQQPRNAARRATVAARTDNRRFARRAFANQLFP